MKEGRLRRGRRCLSWTHTNTHRGVKAVLIYPQAPQIKQFPASYSHEKQKEGGDGINERTQWRLLRRDSRQVSAEVKFVRKTLHEGDNEGAELKKVGVQRLAEAAERQRGGGGGVNSWLRQIPPVQTSPQPRRVNKPPLGFDLWSASLTGRPLFAT